MVQLMIEARSNTLINQRSKIPALESDHQGAVAMSGKLRGTELKRRFCQFAVNLQSADGARYVSENAVDGGKWQRLYFNSFSATIGGGTSQIQANIIGERVLGLPKS
jgi:alkylation response protein AidB-like acyl-CoA dehydrogenase